MIIELEQDSLLTELKCPEYDIAYLTGYNTTCGLGMFDEVGCDV